MWSLLLLLWLLLLCLNFWRVRRPKAAPGQAGNRCPPGRAHRAAARGETPRAPTRPPTKIEGGPLRVAALLHACPGGIVCSGGIDARSGPTAAGRAATFARHLCKGGAIGTASLALAQLAGNLRVRAATAVPLLGGVGGAPRYGSRANHSG